MVITARWLSAKHTLVVCCGYVDFIDGTVYFHLYTWLLFVIMNCYFLKSTLMTQKQAYGTNKLQLNMQTTQTD